MVTDLVTWIFYRNGMDGDDSRHHRRDRLRRARPAVERGADGLGPRPHRPHRVRLHHLLHRRPPVRLLPHAGPRPRQAEPHLHGRRPIMPR